MSDKFGRRPILLFGAFGSFLSSIAFGFSWNIAFALFSRSLNGLLNGTVGVSKTYLGEICDSTTIIRAFSGISLTWGFGSIVGSMLGGLLSQPSTKYPKVFPPTSIFGKFPYLLPNLICALITLIGIILTYIFLSENKKTTIVRSESTDDEYFFEENLTESAASFDEFSIESGLNDKTKLFLTEKTSRNGILTKIRNTLIELKNNPVFKERIPLLVCVCYAMLGLIGTMFDDVFPLFSMAKRENGGLDFGTDQIGIINAFSGAITIPIQLMLYPVVASSYGLLTSFRFGLLLAIPLFPLFPLTNFIKHPSVNSISENILFWSILCLQHFIRQVSSQLCFSGIMTAISNSVLPENMGTVNGLGQSLVAFTRSFAPITGASILELGIKGKKSFPFSHHAVWWVLSVLSFITFLISLKLPQTLNIPKQEVIKNRNEEKNSVMMEEFKISTSSDDEDESI